MHPSTRTTGLLLATVGALLLANAAWFAPFMFSLDPSARMSEYGGDPRYQLYYAVHVVTLTVFALVAVRLGTLRGRTGRRLPGWVTVTVAAFTILVSAPRPSLGLVREGLDNPEIARRLHLSVKTVQNNVSSLLTKLQAGSRVQLVARPAPGRPPAGPRPVTRRRLARPPRVRPSGPPQPGVRW